MLNIETNQRQFYAVKTLPGYAHKVGAWHRARSASQITLS